MIKFQNGFRQNGCRSIKRSALTLLYTRQAVEELIKKTLAAFFIAYENKKIYN